MWISTFLFIYFVVVIIIIYIFLFSGEAGDVQEVNISGFDAGASDLKGRMDVLL